MASKMLLIPEPMYRGLISSSSSSKMSTVPPVVANDENLNLDFVAKNLEKTKKKRVRNLSKKNINYNQELRRFLRLRNQMMNKPVKAKLSNGANIVLKADGSEGGIMDEVGATTASPITFSTPASDVVIPSTPRTPVRPAFVRYKKTRESTTLNNPIKKTPRGNGGDKNEKRSSRHVIQRYSPYDASTSFKPSKWKN
jgi:hypothetical protein